MANTKKPIATDDVKQRSLAARDVVSVSIYMPRALRLALKRAALETEQPVSKLVIAAIEAHLAKSKSRKA